MIDFLRSNTWCSREEYMWQMSIGQVKLASMDFSHVEYKKDKKNKPKKRKVRNAKDLKGLNDLGVGIKTK